MARRGIPSRVPGLPNKVEWRSTRYTNQKNLWPLSSNCQVAALFCCFPLYLTASPSVVIHAVLVLSRAILARFTFARISCAVLVHTNGFGVALRWIRQEQHESLH